MTRRGHSFPPSRPSAPKRRLRHDESAVFVVVEAVLVAVIVLTAILFYTSVQRPQRAGSQGSADLGQVSADLLSILRRHAVTDPAGGPSLNTQAWVTRIMAGDSEVAMEVEEFLDQIVPSGARYVLRLNNGHGTVDMVPTAQVGTPAGAQAAETPFFPLWAFFKETETTDGDTTTGEPTLTSASTTFTAADIGKMVTSAQFPACARIVAIDLDPTIATLSADATGTATGVAFTVEHHWRKIVDAVTTDGVPTITSATAGFSGADIGRKVSGAGIPACATIASVTSVTEATLSANVEPGADGLVWIEPPTGQPGDQVEAGELYRLTQNSQVKCIQAPVPSVAGTEGASLAPGAMTVADGITVGTALTSSAATWLPTDVGRPLSGTGIPLGTTITARVSATEVTMSQAASPASTGIVVTVGNTWVSHWQGSQTSGEERIPAGTPYGMWAGYPNVDCTGTGIYGRVALPGAAAPDDYPIYGLQLVVWYGA